MRRIDSISSPIVYLLCGFHAVEFGSLIITLSKLVRMSSQFSV